MINDINLVKKIAKQMGKGFWEVNNNFFFNKAVCLRYASTIKNYKITYHFFDEVFQELSWDSEPVKSLPEFYKERAQQIRDKYDYLILAVSGGSDSTNMLYSFLDNNIQVEEIISYYPIRAAESLNKNFNYDDKSTKNIIFEYQYALLPLLKKVSTNFPNIKITIIDTTEKALNVVGESALHIMDMSGVTTAISSIGPKLIQQRVCELSSKKTGCVFGVDKPRIMYFHDRKCFGSNFLDFQNLFIEDQNSNIELFYYTPDLPEMFQKQCFEIKNKLVPIIDKFYGTQFYNSLLREKTENMDMFDVQNNFFEEILYPDIDVNNVFQVVKPRSLFYSEGNHWFMNTELTDTRLKSFVEGQINEYVYGIDSILINNTSSDKPSHFKHLSTKTIYF